jgi:hypothetical protein
MKARLRCLPLTEKAQREEEGQHFGAALYYVRLIPFAPNL